MTKEETLELVTRHYLESGDFNGLPVHREISSDAVIELIRDGLVSLNRGDRHPNPHIKAFSSEPIEEQLEKIALHGLDGCLYPEPMHLEKVVDRSKYGGRPFTLALALGEAELSYKVFDTIVLETYQNDPRYSFQVDGVEGSISIADDYFRPAGPQVVDEKDQVLLQTFSFAYNADMKRGVAVFLRYLHDLTPEHQRIWEARLLKGDYSIHPDYWASSMGHWPEKVSVFAAFYEELQTINEMAERMGRKPLFREDFKRTPKPRDFAFLLRPTKRAFQDFSGLLDKMLSDNINLEFFGEEVDRRWAAPREGQSPNKGSIQMLSEWIDKKMRFKDPGPKDETIAALREVRQLRQPGAHSVNQDVYDESLLAQQRELMIRAYGAVRTIRLMLANHPAAKTVEVSEWLFKGQIRTY